MPEPLEHHELAREPLDRLSTALGWAVVLAAALAALGLAVPGEAGVDGAAAAVVVVVASPLLRVGWLVVAWWRTGDRRFVAVGAALLAVIGLGSLVAGLA